MKDLDAFEKAVQHADAMLTKYESSVATLDTSTVRTVNERCDTWF